MNVALRPFFATAMFALLTGVSGAASPFVPPTEAMPPFRRDKLPLDTDTMLSLSQAMTTLSQTADMDEAPQRRAAAQALALALALDPSNSPARDVLSSIAEEKRLRDPDSEKLKNAQEKIWQLKDWLTTPDAGKDGNLLADLLGDTASELDPRHPSASEWRDAGERGKWDGWVAPITAFQERKTVVPPVVANNDPDEGDKSETTPKPADHSLSSEMKSTKATINAVLYEYRASTDSYVLGPVTVSMEASSKPKEEEHEDSDDEDGDDEEKKESDHGGDGLRVSVECHEAVQSEVFDKVSKPITKALADLHHVKESALPAGRIRITTGKGATYSFRRNGTDMSGPGFILSNAALTGIAPDAFFIGKLDRQGEMLELPDFFWKKLNTLIDHPGGRLVVPAAAEPYLTSLLALEKPEFFMKFDVLLASTPEEAVRLCAMQPDAEIAATLAKFKEIRDKSSSAALGSYLANSFVRKRLVEISQAAPYHLSAKLLAIQGAGSRPRALDKKILATEVFEALDTLNSYAEMDIWEMNAEKVSAMDKAQEASRARLSGIERYAEMRDRELIKKAENVIADLRAMIRVVRDRRELWEKTDDISRAHRTFRDANRDFRRELALLTGDPLPKDD